MEQDTLLFWTDGAYSSKTQTGGWSFYCPQYKLKVCGNEKNTTNNRMELIGAIKALTFVDETQTHEKYIYIYSDSQYLVQTMNGKYTKKTNLDLWDKLDSLVSSLFTKHIEFVHVKGHNNSEENNTADRLANLISQI